MVNLNRGVRAQGGDCGGAHNGVSILIIRNFIREYHWFLERLMAMAAFFLLLF